MLAEKPVSIGILMASKMLLRFKYNRSKVLFLFVEGHISLSCLQTEVFNHLRLASLILSSSSFSLSVAMGMP